LPKIFFVNWFRKENGKFLWPGYGENSRVLAYIFDRCDGKGETVDTFVGKVPAVGAINTEGLDLTAEQMVNALAVNAEEWKDEVALIDEHYANFGSHLPVELAAELASLKTKLGI
jgi:phosphoenolpyruvate carboxykinase (GTP)